LEVSPMSVGQKKKEKKLGSHGTSAAIIGEARIWTG